MLIDELLRKISPKAAGRTAQDVRIGLGYTAVLLENRACGLGYTLREEAREGCSVIREAGSLVGRPASELAEWARSLDAIAAAVGLATLNAAIEPPPETPDADLLDLLELTRDDVVGMVGYLLGHRGTVQKVRLSPRRKSLIRRGP